MKILNGLIFVLLLTGINACSSSIEYKGQVIDADTKEPIEGAVVVAEWTKERPGIAGPITFPKDVKETLTNKNGEWSIVGLKSNNMDLLPGLLSFIGVYVIQEPEFIVFKPGYCSWSFARFDVKICKEKSKASGNYKDNSGRIIELPKLTKREDRIMSQSIGLASGKGARAKQREFARLLNEEQRNLGLKEVRYFIGKNREQEK